MATVNHKTRILIQQLRSRADINHNLLSSEQSHVLGANSKLLINFAQPWCFTVWFTTWSVACFNTSQWDHSNHQTLQTWYITRVSKTLFIISSTNNLTISSTDSGRGVRFTWDSLSYLPSVLANFSQFPRSFVLSHHYKIWRKIEGDRERKVKMNHFQMRPQHEQQMCNTPVIENS